MIAHCAKESLIKSLSERAYTERDDTQNNATIAMRFSLIVTHHYQCSFRLKVRVVGGGVELIIDNCLRLAIPTTLNK